MTMPTVDSIKAAIITATNAVDAVAKTAQQDAAKAHEERTASIPSTSDTQVGR